METKNLEESLETIWHFREQGIKNQEKICAKLKEGVNEQIFDELLNEKLIRIENGNIVFTPKGEKIASNITRRHRLAERLLNDVLEVKEGEINKSACEFEHILSVEVTDAICTLLGHPRFCPHGSSIPAGECCKKAKEEVESIIVSLDKLSPGEKGKVAYITTLEHPQLHKFLSLGIIPGKIIHLHQTHPAYVIKVEETQIALEENLAKNIYVRRV